MNLLVFSCCILPLAGAIGCIFFILRKHGLQKQSMIAKCAASFLYVCSAGFALYLKGENPLLHLVFWFALLCMVADGLLEVHFITGMLTFGAGHICLIIWMVSQSALSWSTMSFWVTFMVLTAIFFRKPMKKLKLGMLPFAVYAGILVADFAIAIPMAFSVGSAMVPLAAGTFLFYISDLFVAKSHFSRISLKESVFLMILYWAALYLITSTLWLV